MNITRKPIPVTTIEEFADKHDLEMEMHERKREVGDPTRYYCRFERAELSEGTMLRGAFGNGATEEEAIADYAKEISLGRLVINAYTRERKEIDVPRLKHST